MKSAQELLTALRQSGAETSRIEVKESAWLESNSKSVYKTICAFANEPFQNGGYLMLGVTEREKGSFEVTGVIDADKEQNRLTTTCRGENFSPPVNIECVPETVEGKTVLVVYVPEAAYPHYPVWYKHKREKHVYRRRNSSDVRCTTAEIADLIHVKSREDFDILPNTRASMQDIDSKSIEKYRKILSENQQHTVLSEYDDEKLLFALNCIDSKDGIIYPTNAGILLFGTEFAIMRFFPSFRVDCLSILGFEWVERANERYHDKISFQENLISLADKLLSYVASGLPSRPVFQDHTLQRKDEPLLPIVALREAIINMLIHQDFQQNIPLQIRKYGDRLEIENPGYSLKPLEERDQPRSVPRNPSITNAFHRINYVEALGSGLRSMSRYMQDAGLKEPELFSDKENNFFRCTFSLYHFLKNEDIVWLSQFSDKITENQVRALVEVKKNQGITNATYCEINNLGANEKQARKELQDLCKNNILKMTGKNRWTKYIFSDSISLLSPLSDLEGQSNLLPIKSNNKGKTTNFGEVVSSNSIAPLSPKHELDTGNQEKSLIQVDNDKEACHGSLNVENSIAPLSPNQGQAQQNKTAKPKKKKNRRNSFHIKIDKETLLSGLAKAAGLNYNPQRGNIIRIILQQCTLAPHTSNQLAKLTSLNVRKLKKDFIAPLVTENKLCFLYPEKPNHPKQAYITPDYVKGVHE